jgi:hypothetical protein
MKKIYLPIWLITLAIVFSACEKHDAELQPIKDNIPSPPKSTKYLLRSAEWKTFDHKAEYKYNPDSTLQQITYIKAGVVDFQYVNKNIKAVALSASLYKTHYYYNAAGQIQSVLRVPKQAGTGSTQKFDYQYLANGNVAEMKYWQVTEAGSKLIYTNTYTYNAQNMLTSVTAVAYNGYKIIWTIESYSEVCDFNPLIFMDTELSELYEIYNYPVLSRLMRLPGKIVKSVVTNAQTTSVEKILAMQYTIQQEKLEKAVHSVTYPDHANLNTSSEIFYNYY